MSTTKYTKIKNVTVQLLSENKIDRASTKEFVSVLP